jgi:hypothetical protein
MRRASISVSFLILLCTSLLPVQAQQSSLSQTAPPLPVTSPFGSCPVELTAEQAHDGGLALARDRSRAAHSEQVLDLTIRNSRLSRILSAQIEVGTSPHGRVVALHSAGKQDAVADAVRSLRVEESVPANQQRTHRVSVRDLTSVQWIEVMELTYADGSAWHAGEGRTCRVEPNLVVRVASTH